jgi:glycosyltransferase 2 family protein
MSRNLTPRRIAQLLGLCGAVLLTILIVHEGAAKVAAALLTASWAFPAVALVNLPRVFVDGAAWLSLVPKLNRPRFLTAIWIRWIGGSVNDLLPTARLAGDILTARFAVISGGLPPTLAAGIALVNLTLSIWLRILVTIGTLILIADVTGQGNLYLPIGLAGLVGVIAIFGLSIIQRIGLFRLLAALTARVKPLAKLNSSAQWGTQFDDMLHTLYGRRIAVAGYCLLWLTSCLLGCVETWVTLFALGIKTSFIVALIVETVGQGIRSVFFVVPAGLGVFEGGMVMVCSWFGIPGDIALALSLVRRGREALFSGPGLIIWQVIEGRRILRRERASLSEPPHPDATAN